ncbi:enolase-phosphatase E1-like isoform X2 [Hetaerina americana]
MDEGGEMTPPNEGPDHVPEDNQLTMPVEGEIYMPEEGAEIHAQTAQHEESITNQTSVITTIETEDTIIHQETIEYESEVTRREVEEVICEVEVDFSSSEEELEGGEGDIALAIGGPVDGAPADGAPAIGAPLDGGKNEVKSMGEQEMKNDSTADTDAIHSSEASEPTAHEITKEVEDKTPEVMSEEPQKPPEPPKAVEEPPPLKPVEDPFKYDIVMKSEADGKTEFDMLLSKRSGMLWGFKVKGGRDLDIPLEVKEVHAGGIAEKAGLKVEDMIVAVNDANVLDLSHNHACKTIIDAGDNLKMSVLRPDDQDVSIQIKEAYKKVKVQVTEEYQLLENDPSTLGIDVRKSEEGEVAVIIKGQVLDCEEVDFLSMNKNKEEIITQESEKEAPQPVQEATTENENDASHQEAKQQKITWVANVSTAESTNQMIPEPTEPEVKIPEPDPLILNMPEQEIVKEESNDMGAVPSTPVGLNADYEKAQEEEKQKAYELIIGKIHYVPPPERPYSKSYFYKPKEGGVRNVKWPPKSNISSVIIKPRVLREDELQRERSGTPVPPPAKAAPHSAEKSKTASSPAPSPKPVDEPKPEPAQLGAAVSEQVEGGAIESAVPVQETQSVIKSDSAPSSGPDEAKPAAPEGESQVAMSTEEIAPQPSENQAESSPAEVSQNGAQIPAPAPQEVTSAETAPQPPSE